MDSLAEAYDITLEKCDDCGEQTTLHEQSARNCATAVTGFTVKCVCGRSSMMHSDFGITPDVAIEKAMDCFRGYTLDRG